VTQVLTTPRSHVTSSHVLPLPPRLRLAIAEGAPSCGKICIAEVEEIVEVGDLDPDHIHTPGVYVHRLVLGTHYEKRIEKVVTRTF